MRYPYFWKHPYENISCLKRRRSSSKYLIYYCLLCWYWKNLEDLQLATTGVVGRCWWPSLFQVLSLPKKIRTEKALRTCFTNLTFFPKKKNIHIFRQSALKMLMPQFEKKMFKRIGIHPLQLESYPSVDPHTFSPMSGVSNVMAVPTCHLCTIDFEGVHGSIPTGCGWNFV